MFFGAALALGHDVFGLDGRTGGLSFFGNLIATAAVIVVLIKCVVYLGILPPIRGCSLTGDSCRMAFATAWWNPLVIAGYLICAFNFALVITIESFALSVWPSQYGVVQRAFHWPLAWLFLLWVVVVCIGPEVFFRALKRLALPDRRQVLDVAAKQGTLPEQSQPLAPQPADDSVRPALQVATDAGSLA